MGKNTETQFLKVQKENHKATKAAAEKLKEKSGTTTVQAKNKHPRQN